MISVLESDNLRFKCSILILRLHYFTKLYKNPENSLNRIIMSSFKFLQS